MLNVPVVHPKACSYPKYPQVRGAQHLAVYVPLAEATSTTFPFDAHFTAYSVPDIARRLSTPMLSVIDNRYSVLMQLAIFDVDIDHTRTVTTADLEFVVPMLDALLADHPSAYLYSTSHGYRIIYALDGIILRDLADAARWKTRYVGWCDYLQTRYQITADRSCKDWTRLFRLPRVLRDGVLTTPMMEFGDSSKLGVWDVEIDVSSYHIELPRARVALPPVEFSGRGDALAALNSYVERKGVAAGLITRVIDGTPITCAIGAPGEGRHPSVYRLACVLAGLLPNLGPDKIETLVRPCLESVDCAPKGVGHYVAKLREDYVDSVQRHTEESAALTCDFDKLMEKAKAPR